MDCSIALHVLDEALRSLAHEIFEDKTRKRTFRTSHTFLIGTSLLHDLTSLRDAAKTIHTDSP